MRRLGPAFVLVAAVTGLATPAQANSQTADTPRDAHLVVSDSTVAAGASITLSGDGVRPGATVTVTFGRVAPGLGPSVPTAAALKQLVGLVGAARGGVVLARTTARPDGSWQSTVTIPRRTDPGLYAHTALSGAAILGVATVRVVAAWAGRVGRLSFITTDVLPAWWPGLR